MPLTGLSPFGPIFGKELRTAARRRRNYLLRVAYLGGLLLFLLLAYTSTRSDFGGSTSARAQAQEQLGRVFFVFFSMFCTGAMALIGPVVTSTAINGERQAKTLHVLLMTPLTAWQIVSGKLFSRLLTPLTLIGLSLPVLALVRLLGGVELWEMFSVIGLSATVAMTGAAVGLLLSIVNRRAYAVILLAYFAMAVVYIFTPILIMSFIAGTGRLGMLPWFKFIAGYNPFFAVMTISMQQARMFAPSPLACILGHLAVIAVLLAASAAMVRRLARREGEGAALVVTPASGESTAADGQPVGATPGDARAAATDAGASASSAARAARPARGARHGRTVSDQPVAWRELRRPLMAKRWHRFAAGIVVAALMLLAYGAAYANDGLNDRDFHIMIACTFHTLLAVLACVLAATSIAQEKEGDSWIVLLASPLSGGQIIWGKAVGVLRRLLWPVLLICAHFIAFAVAGIVRPPALVLVLAVIICFNLIWVATGVLASLWFRKVAVAVIVNLALPVALYGALTLVVAVIDQLLHAREGLLNQVLWYLPYYYLTEGLRTRPSGWGGMGGDARVYELPGGLDTRVDLGGFALVAVIVSLLHVAAAAGILALAARALNGMVGRAPQRDPLPRSSPAPDRAAPSWASPAA